MPLHPTPRPQGAGLLVGKQIGRAITAARRRASRQGQCPCTPLRAHRARGYSWESRLAAQLPPLGDGPRGRGSAPAPLSAPAGRGAARGKADWPRNYRRSATGLAARRSGVPFAIVGRHSAIPSRCPSPCTASYRHGTADTACHSGQPSEKASVTQTSHWLFRVRSSPGTRRRRAADYMDHSA